MGVRVRVSVRVGWVERFGGGVRMRERVKLNLRKAVSLDIRSESVDEVEARGLEDMLERARDRLHAQVISGATRLGICKRIKPRKAVVIKVVLVRVRVLGEG